MCQPSSIFHSNLDFPKRFLVCCVWLVLSPVSLLAQDYRNSIASTEFDYITDSDPSTFQRIDFRGIENAEMPDDRPGDRELRQRAYVFVSRFSDGTSVQIAIDNAFQTQKAAEKEAMRYVHRLGKLPTTLRKGVSRLVVHQGGKNSTAFSDIGLIVVYSDNATKRISNHDLEETIFHESVHAAWDKQYASSEGWRRAQAQDGRFVTIYANENPGREDLAETALFAYTLTHHPERIPAADAKKILKAIPARIRFVANLIPPDKPIFYQVGNANGAGKAVIANDETSKPSSIANDKCQIDFTRTGQLSDILSNALMREFGKEQKAVRSFLDRKTKQASDSEQLFQWTMSQFDLGETELKAAIVKYQHCNCSHELDPAANDRLRRLLDQWKPTSKSDQLSKTKVLPNLTESVIAEGSIIFNYVDANHRRRLSLDVYRPKNQDGLSPAIVMYFGGGWQNGRPGLFAPLAQALAQRGYVCIVPEYRLSGEAPFPAAVHDAKSAVRWTRKFSKRFKIDPNRIACIGGSAGGHLSGFVAATSGSMKFEGDGEHRDTSSEVQAAIVMCGPMNLLDPKMVQSVESAANESTGHAVIDFLQGETPSSNEALYRQASPISYAGPHLPPMLFIDGELDNPGKRYIEFRAILDKHQVPNDFVMLEKAPHPFWVFEKWFWPTVNSVDGFLKKHLK